MVLNHKLSFFCNYKSAKCTLFIIINSSRQDLYVMTLPLALFLIADGRKQKQEQASISSRPRNSLVNRIETPFLLFYRLFKRSFLMWSLAMSLMVFFTQNVFKPYFLFLFANKQPIFKNTEIFFFFFKEMYHRVIKHIFILTWTSARAGQENEYNFNMGFTPFWHALIGYVQPTVLWLTVN